MLKSLHLEKEFSDPRHVAGNLHINETNRLEHLSYHVTVPSRDALLNNTSVAAHFRFSETAPSRSINLFYFASFLFYIVVFILSMS